MYSIACTHSQIMEFQQHKIMWYKMFSISCTTNFSLWLLMSLAYHCTYMYSKHVGPWGKQNCVVWHSECITYCFICKVFWLKDDKLASANISKEAIWLHLTSLQNKNHKPRDGKKWLLVRKQQYLGLGELHVACLAALFDVVLITLYKTWPHHGLQH